jgi:hypothetical protein
MRSENYVGEMKMIPVKAPTKKSDSAAAVAT